MPTRGLAGWKNDQVGSYSYGSMLQEVGNSLPAFFFLLLVPQHTQLPGTSALKLWHSPSKALALPAASDRRTMTNNTKPVLPPRVSELAVCMELARGKSAWNSPQNKGFLKQALHGPTCCIYMQNVTHQKVVYKYDPKTLLVHVCFIFYSAPVAPSHLEIAHYEVNYSTFQHCFCGFVCFFSAAAVWETVNSCFEIFFFLNWAFDSKQMKMVSV